MAIVRGGKVLLHVQAFADAVSEAAKAESFGTYPGHSPSLDRAIDIFTPTNSSTLGDKICAFALSNWPRFGVRYIIYRQRINWNDGHGWRLMEDRGDLTQNHFDHVHVSFESEPATTGTTSVTPLPEGEIPMQTIMYQHAGQDFIFCPTSRFHGKLPFGDLLSVLDGKAIVENVGPQSGNFHAGVKAWAGAAKFSETFPEG